MYPLLANQASGERIRNQKNNMGLKRIEDYNNTSLEGYYSIDVSIFSDFSALSNLYILQRTDNDEIKSLLNE